MVHYRCRGEAKITYNGHKRCTQVGHWRQELFFERRIYDKINHIQVHTVHILWWYENFQTMTCVHLYYRHGTVLSVELMVPPHSYRPLSPLQWLWCKRCKRGIASLLQSWYGFQAMDRSQNVLWIGFRISTVSWSHHSLVYKIVADSIPEVNTDCVQ